MGLESTQPTESAIFLATQLTNAIPKPPGIPRTEATLDVVSVAWEAGYDELLAQAKIELTGRHLQGRNPGKALETFSSALTRLLYRPELYGSRSLSQLGRFFPKVIESATCHLDVLSSLVSHLLVGLEAFQEGPDPLPTVLDCPCHNTRLTLGQAPTECSFLDRATDCIIPADSRSLQHAVNITQIETAVATHPDSVSQVTWRMSTHGLSGGQKVWLLRVMLPALVMQCVWQVVWEAHLASHEYDREISHLADLAEHFRFLAISGTWCRLMKVLERHLALIRHAHDPWNLRLGLRGAVGSLESLVFGGRDGYQLKVSLTPVARFRESPTLMRPTIRGVHDVLGRVLSGLTRRFDDHNGTVEVSIPSGLLGYIPLPGGLVLAGNGGNARFMARLLRARVPLERDQGFDALLLSGGLEQTNSPSVVCLASEIQMLTSLVRIQMSYDAVDRLENQPAPHESGIENQ